MPIILAIFILAFWLAFCAIVLTVLINPVLAVFGFVIGPGQMMCLLLFFLALKLLMSPFNSKKR